MRTPDASTGACHAAVPAASRAPDLDLGVIGNGTIGALVDRMARIVWCCLPRLDGDPVFCGLLESDGGSREDGVFAVELERFAHSRQHYDPGTAVLRTELFDEDGQGVEVTDFAPRFVLHDRLFRPAQVVRRVRPLRGRPRIRIRLRPRGEWNAQAPRVTRGSNHIRYLFPSETYRLSTDAPPSYVIQETWFSLHATANFVFGTDETLGGGIDQTAGSFEAGTVRHWREWTRRLALPFEWQDAVIRAAITLKLCQYEETGAIVAALTTSVPEAPDSGRNWDYRYCWLRDAFFVVRALNSLAEVGTMEDYLRWLHDVIREARGGHVQPLYGIGLECRIPESAVPTLGGYRGMGPVRVGNQAYEHHQHDVYGNIILGAAQAFVDRRLFRPADRDDFRALQTIGERAWLLHDQPDAGMWELRTRARVHTSSSLMCWAACDRLAKIGRVLADTTAAQRWRERADRVRARILEAAWSERRQAFAAAFGADDLDASVLLMAEVGFIDPADSRFVSTVDALERALCDGPYMRRYEAPDDFGVPSVAFNVCSFWRIDALSRIGRHEDARAVFETMLSRRNALGLLSEDLDMRTGELWGNFPQTYSMVGIVNGAMRLSRGWDEVV